MDEAKAEVFTFTTSPRAHWRKILSRRGELRTLYDVAAGALTPWV